MLPFSRRLRRLSAAEWQVKPFGGITFGGTTTFVNLDDVAGSAKFNLGVSVLWQGNIVGLEGDVATTAGFFSGEKNLILKSHVATVTGNVVVAMPKRMLGYGLRPYVVGGLGVMQVGFCDNLMCCHLRLPDGMGLGWWSDRLRERCRRTELGPAVVPLVQHAKARRRVQLRPRTAVILAGDDGFFGAAVAEKY